MAEEDFEDEDWSKPVESLEGVSLKLPAEAQSHSAVSTCTIHSKPASSKTSSISSRCGSGFQAVNTSHGRTIIHIDLDCFYAQVEMVRNPSLRTKPLGIQQKYLLVTCNYVARSRGVTKLMRVTDALQKCPDLVIVSGEDLTHYREMSYRITELLQQFSPLVERLGFDENFVDVTRLVAQRLQGDNDGETMEVFGHVYGETANSDPEATDTPACTCGCYQRLVIGSHIAHEMREALQSQLRLTSCAGVAHNKLLAKLVGSTHKPNDQTTLFPHMVGRFMGSLDKVVQVPGIGHSMSKKLSSMGITTLNELIEAPFTLLKDEFGHQTASTMQKLCQGSDESPVVQSGPPQSISDEDSFKKCNSLQQAHLKIKSLLNSLLQRLKKDGRQPRTLRLSVRKFSKVHKWTRESRQCGLPEGILHSLQADEAATTSKLLDLCVVLFHKMVDTSQPFHLTLINVCFAKFQSPSKTGSDISKFFSPKSTKKGRDNDATSSDDGVLGKDEVHDSQQEIISQNDADLTTGASEILCVPKSKVTNSSGPSDDGICHMSKTTIPRTSHHELYDTKKTLGFKDERSLSSLAGSCSTRSRSHINNIDKCRPSDDSDVDNGHVSVNEQSASPTPRKVENEAGHCNNDASPRKRMSFFALKSESQSASWTRDKDQNLTAVNTRADCTQACSRSMASEQLSLPASCSAEIAQGVSAEHMAPSQEGDTSHAVPPNVDPSVFSELPSDVQQELLNEWRESKPSVVSAPAEGEKAPGELHDIDQAVFEELPSDIQRDVLEQQRQKKRTLSSLSPQTKRTQPGKKLRTGKISEKGVGKSKNITDFFSRK